MTAPYDKLEWYSCGGGSCSQGSSGPKAYAAPLAIPVTATVTTTVRVVDSVHNDTTDTWALTLVAVAASFTNLDVLVLLVADDTDGWPCILS